MSESKSVLKRLDIQQATTWKSWVQTVGGDEWNTNACVYATKEEAQEAGTELASRWLLVKANEARPTDEPVNYTFNFDSYRSESIK